MVAAGQKIRALDFTETVQASDTTAHLNISTTPSLGSPEVGVTFTAPTSGKVLVTISGSVGESGGTVVAGVLDYRVYENNSSGAIVFALGSLIRRVIITSPASNQAQELSRTSLLTGLTPGGVYYAQVWHASYGAAVDLYVRAITVAPVVS